ncbi:MAG: Thiol:disulfide interchange protein DsbD [Ignavibacteria bacterium]|nr:Thiol:disulfide interchange protein DsbD [Ignavibacteria bacterium]
MKPIFKILFLILILFFTGKIYAEDVSFSNGTYQEILDLAKQQDKVIMIDFVTDWCKWCVETDRKVYTNPDVASFANLNQINWKIDAEKGEGPELAKKYSVKGFPTIVFTKSNGEEIDRIYGFVPAEQFLKLMKDYNSGINTYSYFRQMLDKTPDDPELNFKMAEKITNNGLEEDVKIYLNKTISTDPENLKGYTDDSKFMLAYLNNDADALKNLIKEYPESEKVKEGYINLASYYSDKNDDVTAEKYFAEAFDKYGKSDFDLVQNYGNYLIGKAYKTMKAENSTKQERDDAIKTLEKCVDYVKGTVNEASTYYMMSELYFQNKDIKKAGEFIDKAISIYDKKSYRDQKEKINKSEAKN